MTGLILSYFRVLVKVEGRVFLDFCNKSKLFLRLLLHFFRGCAKITGSMYVCATFALEFICLEV